MTTMTGGRTRLFAPRDWALMLGLALLGLVLRLVWYGGYGLGDDAILYQGIAAIVRDGRVGWDANGYRFVWWLPTALLARAVGARETAFILPVVTAATLGTCVVYALGLAMFGRLGAVLAALLLVTHPLDFAWSTLLATDIFCSVPLGLCIFFVLRALELADPAARRTAWRRAAVCLWLAYHAKISAMLLAPALAIILVLNRRKLDRTVLSLFTTGLALFVGSALVMYVFTGSWRFPLEAELRMQGLTGPVARQWHRVSPETFRIYFDWLFKPDWFGHYIFGAQPALIVALALLAPFLGLRTSAVAAIWFLCLFVAMELNVQRAEGAWVAGFRNPRHGHVWIYPMVLMLTGFLLALYGRWRRVAIVLAVAVLAFGLWQSIAVARIFHLAHADRRAACWFLATQPAGAVYSDFQLGISCEVVPMPGFIFPQVKDDKEQRRQQFAQVPSGYAVTGGGRMPYYGCTHCIPLRDELNETHWELLLERAGPVETWRPEAMRIWRRNR